MLQPGRRRAATRFAAAAALVVALAGCGKPPNLDREQQRAFARACTSLVERGLSDDDPPRDALLGGEEINLDDPVAFYSILERLRGASTFNLHDPKHSADTGRKPLDDCDTKPKVMSSLLGSRSDTTTTSTTSTTVTTTTVPGT